MTEVYVSTKEAGRRLGISNRTVLTMLHLGQLRGYAQTTLKSGRVHAWKIAESSIDAYITRQRRRISA